MEEPNKPESSDEPINESINEPINEVVSDETSAPVETPEEPEAPVDPVAARKRAIVGLIAAIAIGAAATAIAYYAEAYTGHVAKVDGARISKAEYEQQLLMTKRSYAQRFNVDFASAQGRQMENDLRTGLINQLVEREIIRSEARRRAISVPDAAVAAKIAEIKKGFKSEAEFQDRLKGNGIDQAGFERQVRDMVEVEQVVSAITADAKVTDDEVKRYYDQNRKMYDRPQEVRARHVLVKDEITAKLVQQKVKGGGDFAAIAREYSEDPGSKNDGGDLGYFGRGKMVKEFEDAAFTTPPGQLSPLVKTKFGWHLLKVEDRKAPRTQPFSEVKDEIRENLASERRRAAFSQWLAKRKADVRVEYKPGYAPAAPPPGGSQGGDDGHGHGADDGHGH